MYTPEQYNALVSWVGAKHQSIADYFDAEHPNKMDRKNSELAEVWRDAICKSPLYTGIVYRGMCANQYRCHNFLYVEKLFRLNEEEEYCLTRPCSFTTSKEIGENWAIPNVDNQDIDHVSVLLIARVTRGRDIREGPRNGARDEEEIVLLPGLQFRVTKVENKNDKLRAISGEMKQKTLWLEEIGNTLFCI